MDFFLVVLIFITFMIVLALLIYYCQEKSAKYSFTDNQRAISAIALSIGAPAGLPPDFFKYSPYAPTVIPYPPQPPPPGFIHARPPSPVPDDELSDSGSSTSSKIYFTPNTAAYSVAKRMSIAAKIQRKMSEQPRQTYITPKAAAAYILARKMAEKANRNDTNSSVTINEVCEDGPKIQKNIVSPISTIKKQNASDSSDSDERFRSSYIPATVAAFNLRSKSRSGSPYIPLYNEIPSAPPLEILNGNIREHSPMRSESLPPIQNKENNSQKQSICLPKRGGSLPPKQPETTALMHSESSYSEKFPFAYSEIDYRSHSPTPLQQLHTVEEE